MRMASDTPAESSEDICDRVCVLNWSVFRASESSFVGAQLKT